MDDEISRKIIHHRSISQLIENLDKMSLNTENGTSNPALDDTTNDFNSTISTIKLDDITFNNTLDPISPDSEYDEELGFPDSVTILTIADNPILVERKKTNTDELDREDDDDDDDDGNNTNVQQIQEMPFLSVYQQPIKFTSFQRKMFIPGVETQVEIIDHERNMTTHLLNPNLYTIQLTHGKFIWTIKKRYKHFNALHQSLRIFRASLNFPFPSRSHKERRISFRNNQVTATTPKKLGKKKRKNTLPRFPIKPDAFLPAESVPLRIKQLEEYLYNLLNISLYRNHHETVNFLEVSTLSFISAFGDKGKEGPVKKRTGSTRPGQSGCNFCGFIHNNNNCCIRCNFLCSDVICGKWRNRWFFIKDTFFGYYKPKDGSIRSIVLFDQGFDISSGGFTSGTRNGIQLITYSRQMILKCWTRRKAREWMNHLKMIANTSAREFTISNPHTSFAPVRTNIQSGWYVDGASYMSAVADGLEGANEEIYIADWWLSPEIYMKRPAIDGDYWRLDKILQRKAEQGIKVFVLLYKEVELALGINSYYSKQKLVATHENIKVIRHPDHAKIGIFFWAHHEKIVVIDQTYAFIGGIDLCYGRWDDYRHRLTDLGSIATASCSGSGQIRNSVSFSDMGGHKLGGLKIDVHSKKTLPILEPGDRLLMMRTKTPEPCPENMKRDSPGLERRSMLGKFKDNVKSKSKDFMYKITDQDGGGGDSKLDETTHYHEKTKIQQDSDNNMFFSKDEIKDGQKGINYISPVPFENKMIELLDGQAKLWIGKDYTNFIMKDFTNLDAPFADLVDRTITPRMPWHDIGAVVIGASARDVSRHFIQRWNAVKLEKAKDSLAHPYLIPKGYNNIKIDEKFLTTPLQRCSCQILRSVSSWSCGFIETDLIEQSIHEAYIQTITTAQHYIYIENQFFISMDIGSNGSVRNQIAETLIKRICRAHRQNSVFRVYVVMPLLPGFEGDVGGDTGISLRAITHWNYASISRGKNSLLSRLKAAGIEDPSEYISFHSLRTNAMLNGFPITELIYVHSKLLIADDKTVIIGSANINDRSLIGKRDSEIAVLITDESFEEGRMNGEPFPTGLYSGKLRKFLFKEHLGLLDPDPDRLPIDVSDPIIDSFWNGTWQRNSRRNTKIYDAVFKCIPTNEVTTFIGLKKYIEEPALCKTDVAEAIKEINRIQGFIVDLPLEFLNKEILTPPGNSKEGIIPTSVWT